MFTTDKLDQIETVRNGHIKYVGGERYTTDMVEDFETAEQVANYLTLKTGTCFLPIDRGERVSPRYDVVKFDFKPGDEVSMMGLNVDYYPQGAVKKVSENKRIVTLYNGKRFFRRGLTDSWIYDKCWTLVPGTISELNPEF